MGLAQIISSVVQGSACREEEQGEEIGMEEGQCHEFKAGMSA